MLHFDEFVRINLPEMNGLSAGAVWDLRYSFAGPISAAAGGNDSVWRLAIALLDDFINANILNKCLFKYCCDGAENAGRCRRNEDCPDATYAPIWR